VPDATNKSPGQGHLTMKIAIIGSRDFNDYTLFKLKCLKLLSQSDISKITIISGGARGTDRMAERYAREMGIPLKVINAEWDILGKKAGMIRNEEVLLLCTHVIAFWDGSSPGTRHVIIKAKILNKKLRVVRIKTGAPASHINPQGSGLFYENK